METCPPKRLVRIEDFHLEIWTEWIGVRTDKERGKRGICSILENTGTVKIRVHGELHKGPCSKITSSLIFSSLENIKKPWLVPSRRLVIQRAVFHVPDLTPLSNAKEEYTSIKYQDVYCKIDKSLKL